MKRSGKWKHCLSDINTATRTAVCGHCGNVGICKRSDGGWRCNKSSKLDYGKLKQVVYDHYGWTCATCGISDERVLSIDHINNDGGIQRRKIRGNTFLKWIIKNNFPTDLQILCMNCQWIKRCETKQAR